MNLKSATVFTIVGICYFYLIRTINTVNPDMLRIQDIAQAVQLLSMIASLAPLVFLGYFYKDYIRREQVLLKYITLIAFIGFSLIVFLRIRDLFMVFPRMSSFLYNFSPTLYYWFKSYQMITMPERDIDSYTVLDARLAWRPRPELELSLVGQNLLESEHSEFSTLEVERSIYAKIDWKF